MSLAGSYAKAVAGALPIPVVNARPKELDLDERVLEDVEIDQAHLAAYNRVCGFRLTSALPPTYLHVLAFPSALGLMTERSFPFGVLGLVHIENRIEQHRPVQVSERPTLTVRAENLRDHAKGRAVDLVGEAHVDGALVWRDVSTYLRIGGGSGSSSEGDAKKSARDRPRRPRGGPFPATSDAGTPTCPATAIRSTCTRSARSCSACRVRSLTACG